MVYVNRPDFLVRIYISRTGPTEVDFAFLQIAAQQLLSAQAPLLKTPLSEN